MTYHAHIGGEIIALEREGHFAPHVNAIEQVIQRLGKRPYLPGDARDFIKAFKDFDGSFPARITYEIAHTGKTARDLKLDITQLALLLTQDEDTHYYVARGYQMTPAQFTATLRPFPLSIVAPHLAVRKMGARKEAQRTLFEYNPRFTYVLAAALLTMDALNREDVPETSAENVYIPSKFGLYVGQREPAPFSSLAGSVRYQFQLARDSLFGMHIPVAEDWCNVKTPGIIPRNMIVLKTFINDPHFRHEKQIYERLYNILKPAKDSGLLTRICLAYASVFSLTADEVAEVHRLTDAIAGVLRSPEWEEARQRKAQVHLPAAEALRTGQRRYAARPS